MSDLIWIVLDVISIIALIYFIRCEKENTKARKEQTKQLKKENELLDKLIKKADMISKLQASYKQVKDGEIKTDE